MQKNDPKKLANSLRHRLQNIKVSQDTDRLVSNIGQRIRELSKELFPNEPIISVMGQDFDDLTGMLIKVKGNWHIIYNTNLPEKVVNFTIAHEFGHYLMHRTSNDKIECQPKGKYKWNSEYGNMEREGSRYVRI